MKLIPFLLGLVTSLLLAEPKLDIYEVNGISKNDTLSVKSQPKVNSKKIGELSFNATSINILKCVETEDIRYTEWCKVKVNDYNLSEVKWVAKKFLKKSLDNKLKKTNKYVGNHYKVIRHKPHEFLNVRAGTSVKYRLIDKLSYDKTGIEIVSCLNINNKKNSRWCWINYKNDNNNYSNGWVSAKYLKNDNSNVNIENKNVDLSPETKNKVEKVILIPKEKAYENTLGEVYAKIHMYSSVDKLRKDGVFTSGLFNIYEFSTFEVSVPSENGIVVKIELKDKKPSMKKLDKIKNSFDKKYNFLSKEISVHSDVQIARYNDYWSNSPYFDNKLANHISYSTYTYENKGDHIELEFKEESGITTSFGKYKDEDIKITYISKRIVDRERQEEIAKLKKEQQAEREMDEL